MSPEAVERESKGDWRGFGGDGEEERRKKCGGGWERVGKVTVSGGIIFPAAFGMNVCVFVVWRY